MDSLFSDVPRDVQRALNERSDAELTRLLADVSMAVALRRDVSPHQVLREELDAYGWPESEWPKARDHVRGWLSTPLRHSDLRLLKVAENVAQAWDSFEESRDEGMLKSVQEERWYVLALCLQELSIIGANRGRNGG